MRRAQSSKGKITDGFIAALVVGGGCGKQHKKNRGNEELP
jgi:hypothetical protein